MEQMHQCLNLVLLGKTGSGKSTSGNTILGREAFKSKKSLSSVTQVTAVESGTVDGLSIAVYDTPGLCDSELEENEMHLKYQSLFQRCESGPCAFLLVIKADRFTEEERKNVFLVVVCSAERWLRRIPVISPKSHDEPDTPVSSLSARRMVLLGKTGVGKSASGNTILGHKEFESVMRMTSVTHECSDAHATVSGRSVSVVDTPGFFDTHMNPKEIMTEIARSVYLSSPGPHAFLIVFNVIDRFTEHELQIPQQIEMMFGEEVLKYSIILFTHGDLLEEETVERIIEENSTLRRLVNQCRTRYHVFNNKDRNNREQVNDLLQKIDTMIEQNGGGHYSNEMFEDAQRLRQEEEEQRQREEEERKWREERKQEKKKRLEEIEREVQKRQSKPDSESDQCIVV